MMRASLPAFPWGNPRPWAERELRQRHVGASASALSCRHDRIPMPADVVGPRSSGASARRRGVGRRSADPRLGPGCSHRRRRAACAGRGDGDAHRAVALRRPGVDRSHRRRRDPRRPAAGQHLRESRRGRRAARPRPPELRPGRADLGARLRCALDLRHPRRPPLRRRHPRDLARRTGPDHQRRPRLGRADRGPARPLLGALRQLGGGRDPGVHRRGQRRADLRRERRCRQLRCAALRRQGERWRRRLRLRRQRQHLSHRRLSRAQRRRAQHRQRQDHLARRRQSLDAGRQQRRLAEGAGSARPDTGAVRCRSAQRRSRGDDLRYPQDGRPDAVRRRLRASRRRRQLAARALLQRPPQHRAVPGDPGRRAGESAPPRRRDRARPRLPRHRLALDREDAASPVRR